MVVIGLVADVPENYFNVKRLWLNADMESLKQRYTVATHLKLCNILVGMMSHSSSHPCWCDTHTSNLKNKGTQRTIANVVFRHLYTFAYYLL